MTPSVQGATQVNINELKEILKTQPPEQAIMVWGPPGIGKTEAVRQAALETEAICFEEILSTKPPEDLEGVPFPVEKEEGKFTHFAPPVRFAALVGEDGPPAYFFMDELNTAQPHIQVVAMQIALEKRVGAQKLRGNVRIVAAGNRASDRAAVNPMPKPLENRFEHYEVVVDSDIWVRWALEKGIDPTIIAFIRSYPNKLHQFNPDSASPAFATPRSYEMADRRLKSNGGWGDALVMKKLAGCIGEGVATELVAYRKLQDELPDPAAILKDGDSAPMPPASKPDRRYFIMTALTAQLFKKSTKSEVREAVKYVMRMEADFGAKFMHDIIMTRNDATRHFLAIIEEPDIEERFKESWGEIFELAGQIE